MRIGNRCDLKVRCPPESASSFTRPAAPRRPAQRSSCFLNDAHFNHLRLRKSGALPRHHQTTQEERISSPAKAAILRHHARAKLWDYDIRPLPSPQEVNQSIRSAPRSAATDGRRNMNTQRLATACLLRKTPKQRRTELAAHLPKVSCYQARPNFRG